MIGLASHRGITLAVAALALSLTATSLSACGSRTSSSSDSIHVWVYQDASTTVQKSIVATFNKTSSVKVILDQIPSDGYLNKLRTGMGSSNAPDVFFNWGGGSIRDYVASGKLVDLTPTLTADPTFKQAFLPSILNAGKINDKYYGIPMRGTQPVMLFYNKAVFTAAGVQPPSSWADLLALIRTFKAKGITPFSLAGANSWTELMWVEYLLDRYGGSSVFTRIQNGDTSAWSDPSVLKTAQTIQSLVASGAFGQKFGSVSYTAGGASTLFAKGKTAMHLMGSWEYANQLSTAPSFAKSDLGWTTFPAIPGGSGDPASVVGNPTNYWSISSSTKNKAAAIAFVKLAASDAYAKLLVANGDVPTTSNATSLLAASPNPTYANFQFNLVKNAPSFTLSWDQALSSQVATPLLTLIQKLFNKQLTPQQFVTSAKALT